MSKAFLKDDAPSDDLVVMARPPLPANTPNYVTARGLQLLQGEEAALLARRSRLQEKLHSVDAARELSVLQEELADLQDRLKSAELVTEYKDAQVGFGASVEARVLNGKFKGEARKLTIVGADEAASREGGVAFYAPIAKALMGKRCGDKAVLQTPRGKQELEILAVSYED